MNLTPLFAAAVPEMNRQQTATLGDRGSYIGSSDIAGCARKAFLQRQFPRQHSITTLLKYARGHAAEWLLDRIFQAGGAVYDTQVEVRHPDVPMKAHCDFVFYEKNNLHVVETKSVSGIPDAAYPAWEDQLYFQLGMLRIQYPKGNIGGSILAIDLNAGEIHQFNGYEYDPDIFQYLFDRGLRLLDALNDQAEARPSPSHLCGYCQYRTDCPAMALPEVQLPPEIEMLTGKYVELNEIKGRSEKEMKAIRQELVDFTGPVFRGRSDNYDLIVSTVDGSLTVDGALLKKLYPDVYPNVLKGRAGYSRLEVKPVRQRDR
jgi:CRISPR-associated exonuclease Cas4